MKIEVPGYQVVIEQDYTALAFKGAQFFLEMAKLSKEKWGIFKIAISGGSTPRGMHTVLAQEDFRSKVPWDKTHIFWADERFVPYESNLSNFGTAKRDFLSKLPLPHENIHPIPIKETPELAAETYEAELRRLLFLGDPKPPLLDLVFLGIGADGHVASLFPGSSVLEEGERWIGTSMGGEPPIERVTMTLILINQASVVVIMASGAEKADIVKRVLKDNDSSLPASRVNPSNGRLVWLLDQEAASRL